jgi:hypothetical protein
MAPMQPIPVWQANPFCNGSEDAITETGFLEFFETSVMASSRDSAPYKKGGAATGGRGRQKS